MAQSSKARVFNVPHHPEHPFEWPSTSGEVGGNSKWDYHLLNLGQDIERRLYSSIAPYSQSNFSVHFNGSEVTNAQCVCVSIAAAVYVDQCPPQSWTTCDHYMIIRQGNEFYASTLNYVVEQRPEDGFELLRKNHCLLGVSNLPKSAILFKCLNVIFGEVYFGPVFCERSPKGRPCGLQFELTKLFDEDGFTRGVLITRKRARAVFKVDTKFYIYDPHPVAPYKKAVLVQVDSIEEMVNLLKEFIQVPVDSSRDGVQFDLVPLKVEVLQAPEVVAHQNGRQQIMAVQHQEVEVEGLDDDDDDDDDDDEVIEVIEPPYAEVPQHLVASTSNITRFRCDLTTKCKAIFADQKKLQEHQLKCHLSVKRPYMCVFPNCSYDSHRWDHVSGHAFTHRNEEHFVPPVPLTKNDPWNARFVALMVHLLPGANVTKAEVKRMALAAASNYQPAAIPPKLVQRETKRQAEQPSTTRKLQKVAAIERDDVPVANDEAIVRRVRVPRTCGVGCCTLCMSTTNEQSKKVKRRVTVKKSKRQRLAKADKKKKKVVRQMTNVELNQMMQRLLEHGNETIEEVIRSSAESWNKFALNAPAIQNISTNTTNTTKRYSCHFCTKQSFADNFSLYCHYAKNHQKIDPQPFQCTFGHCGYTSKRRDSARNHVYSHRREDTEDFKPTSKFDTINWSFVGIKFNVVAHIARHLNSRRRRRR